MQQAGINKIVLYENLGINLNYYDPFDRRNVTDISNTGDTYTIENKAQPEFDIVAVLTRNNKTGFKYIMKFFIFDLTFDELDNVAMLKESIYGWCPLVYFYDGTIKFYNTPLKFFGENDMKIQESMNFAMELETPVVALERYLLFTEPSAFGYRADTTVITADSTAYTADYVTGA